MRTLEFAAEVAPGSSLCVVETQSYPVHGWAAVTGATNLLTGEQTKLDGSVAQLLERLVCYGSYGYRDSWGRQHARRILDDLRAAGMTDWGFILSALAARDIPSPGQENLAKLINRAQPGRR